MGKYDHLIGVPFAYGGRGPDTYDCYGLLRKLYKDDGIDIPDYRSPEDGPRITALMMGELRLWQRSELQIGRAILFTIPEGFMHVGYYIGNDRFIHTWEVSGGVLTERLSDWKRRVIGYYKYVG